MKELREQSLVARQRENKPRTGQNRTEIFTINKHSFGSWGEITDPENREGDMYIKRHGEDTCTS